MAVTVHPSAVISSEAIVEDGVSIGPFTLVLGNVKIGRDSVVGSHCLLGSEARSAQSRLIIGEASLIRSHCVFYEGSIFGKGLSTGHHVTVREGIDAGVYFQIGTHADLQGFSRIGDHVRTHSDVFIAQYSTIGDFAWLLPYTVLANDPLPPSDDSILGPTIGEYAVLAARSTIMPGIRVGAGAVVAANALVTKDVEPGMVVAGVPAAPIGPASSFELRSGSGPAYPWRRHFRRGYPEEVIKGWNLETE